MTEESGYHVLTKAGDASAEVEAALREVGTPADAGLHRYFFVERARQTVVMTTDAASPIAKRLRQAGGWLEPGLASQQ